GARTWWSIWIVPHGHVRGEQREIRPRVEPQIAHIGEEWEVLRNVHLQLWVRCSNGLNRPMQCTGYRLDMWIVGRRVVEHDRRTTQATQRPEAPDKVQTALTLVELRWPALPLLV